MRIYIVAANVQDRNKYKDYATLPTEKCSWMQTVHDATVDQYGEYVSIMGVYGSRAQAEHRARELTREGFGVFPIVECTVDANCWKYIGGYAE